MILANTPLKNIDSCNFLKRTKPAKTSFHSRYMILHKNWTRTIWRKLKFHRNTFLSRSSVFIPCSFYANAVHRQWNFIMGAIRDHKGWTKDWQKAKNAAGASSKLFFLLDSSIQYKTFTFTFTNIKVVLKSKRTETIADVTYYF